ERVEAQSKKLVLEGGEEVAYDNLVIATGGTARRGSAPGFDSDNVVELRTTEDADKLRSLIGPGKKLGIIGAGLVGAEVASSARKLGADVVLID
ncbi:FAD-dependent oxidoreductase, partial [Escherichia coli]|nr:FAD-dependent oxidoreductase [Escherichia coli]